MINEHFSWRKRLKSFSYAFAGLKVLMRDEHNAWIHTAAAICAVAAGLLLHISRVEWLAVFIVIGMVFAAEIFNSSVERIADFLTTEYDERIGKIKDLAAAAVLVCAITAVAVALFIFVPKVVALLA